MLLSSFVHPQLGLLKNRVVMSAMTRGFATPSHEATEAIARYYRARAEAGVGLILSEGIIVDPSGDGYRNVPHLATSSQAQSWRQVTSAVQEFQTLIFAQLWHCGRFSHEDFTEGAQPLSSSAVAATGVNRQNGKPYATPRPMEAEDFARVSQQFDRATQLAMEAGFDGVQLHFGHGYLIDSFLDGNVNDRTDGYGGSPAKRVRFAAELTERALAIAGDRRVIVRISPIREIPTPYAWTQLDETLECLLEAFERVGLRMMDISCARADYHSTAGVCVRKARAKWKHTILAGASLNLVEAENEIAAGGVDLVTFGRALIANPDLVRKFERGEPLAEFAISQLAALD
jgi:N-ethylmaleimide reductase